jgi:hypothetical protein
MAWARPEARREQQFAVGFKTVAVGTLKRYSKVFEYEYRVKTTALDTLKRYFIFSLTIYLE